jgi:hypothetical protein
MATPDMPTNAGPGRPQKFGRSARAVTLTLPHDVIERLAAMDADLGRAIVQLVERAPAKGRAVRPPAEVASCGTRSVILVTPVRAWKRLPGVQLVPVSDARALIALEHPHGIPQLELDLRDVVEKGPVTPRERAVFEAVADILKHARANHSLTVAERSIIVFEGRRRRSGSAS